MEGDPRNPKISLLKKFDIPIDNLSYEYVEKCEDKKELEKIIKILRSGEEGSYPDLLRVTKNRLRLLAPDSRVLRVETPILTKETLTNDEWDAVEKDLLEWEQEMKVIDKSLDIEKSRIDIIGNKNLPGIRKVNKQNEKMKGNEEKAQINSKNERIKSGDYSAWDKYDVDKELLKIEIDEERKEEENAKKKREMAKFIKEKKFEIGDVDKESYSSTEQQILANQAKDRGNECYKSGDLQSALKYYDLSIKLCPTLNSYNNRAMTYLKLKEYDKAVKDCDSVLNLDVNNVKALHRRATAFESMSDANNNFAMLALQDLYRVVLLEPNNRIAQTHLQKLKTKFFGNVGKMFRMPIQEEDNDTRIVNTIKTLSKENNTTMNMKDNSRNVESLPLTYYGPSTSTFQCEPYSMVHRALTSSLLSNTVMCKCNSSRCRQNPLCQKCGEAMSTPKSSSKPVLLNAEKNPKNKTNNDVINSLQKSQQNKSNTAMEKWNSEKTETSKENSCDIKNKLTGNEERAPRDESKNTPISEIQFSKNTEYNSNKLEKDRINNDLDGDCITLMNKENISNTLNENQYNAPKSNETKNIQKVRKLEKKLAEEFEDRLNINNVNKVKNAETSQSESKRSSHKSKNKKKKSIDQKIRASLELMEPLKVVHAAKYIQSTSVEPNAKRESLKVIEKDGKVTGSNQFKPFVANRQCLSLQRDDAVCESHPKTLAKKVANVGGCRSTNAEVESNKENVLNALDPFLGKQENKTIDSAYEFIKVWEESKKLDHSYAKRAEIIRLVRPSELGKVIGMQLDSDMLSSLLECLEKQFVETDPQTVVDFLSQLPQVPRFGLIKMFLLDEDKKRIRNLIAAAESRGFTLEEDIKAALAVSSS